MSKKCTPLWREAHFQVKMYKITPSFGPLLEVEMSEKVHAVVARSTFRSQNVQNTTCSRHFWRFGFGKSARRCGAKHISKSKCTKHRMFAPLLAFRCRFAHYTYTTLHTLHTTTLQPQLHNYTTTLHYTELHSATLRSTTLNYTPLHYTTFHYTSLHYIALRYTHYTTTTLHNYTPLHSTTLKLHYTTLHYTTLH